MSDPTQRFSNRVSDYVKYRPSYPPELIQLIDSLVPKTAELADIGAGTGILSKLLCEQGYHFVYGIEPNQAMYTALQEYMADHDNFSPSLSSAEDTELEDQSIDLITCAQSFHWFDVRAAKSEFYRILKPGGWIILIWNTWRKDIPFGAAYEQLLLDHGTDYKQVAHTEQKQDRFDILWGEGEWIHSQFENRQELDLQGMKGRIFSSSYTPAAGEVGHEAMSRAIEQIFGQFATDGTVEMEYTTDVYYGQIRG